MHNQVQRGRGCSGWAGGADGGGGEDGDTWACGQEEPPGAEGNELVDAQRAEAGAGQAREEVAF